MLISKFVLFASAFTGLLAVPSSAVTTVDFTGDFAVSNWTETLFGSDGSVDTSSAPNSIIMVGSNNGSTFPGRTDFQITVPLPVSALGFDWSYSTSDTFGPFDDHFGYSVNGFFTQLSADGGGSSQSGSAYLLVEPGDTFAFSQRTTTNRFGAASTTISNFHADAVPEPSSLIAGLVGLVGLSMRRRR